jgi:hypothetical protein
MTLLFSNRSWPEKVRAIYTATLTHAKNLAKFVTVYKLLLILQRRLRAGVGAGAGNAERGGVAGKSVGAKGVERGLDSFVAGLVGGYWVFGERTAVSRESMRLLILMLDMRLILCTVLASFALYRSTNKYVVVGICPSRTIPVLTLCFPRRSSSTSPPECSPHSSLDFCPRHLVPLHYPQHHPRARSCQPTFDHSPPCPL